MVTLLEQLAEARIREAAERGAFDDLPGRGRPLALDDDALIPEELRTAYRILKNAGYVPPEVETRREIANVGQLLAALEQGEAREDPRARHARRRLRCLDARLALQRGRESNLLIQDEYFERLTGRLGR